MRRSIKRKGRNLLIFIVGPTAIGKTKLAVSLARNIGGEVVSCDSMQVYKRMPILSQYPSAKERRYVKHHLISIVEPAKEYSVASFRKAAIAVIEDIVRRGGVPIITGGTGLYAKALIDGLFASPKTDLAFRRKSERYAVRYGKEKLYAKLTKIDPLSASKIHPNDLRRVIRALELYHSTGRTMTELKSGTKGLSDAYDIRIFGLTGPREDIYAAIDARVDRMFEDGLVREVKKLKKINMSRTARAALGFKEIAAYIGGDYDLATAKALVKMNTRRFAKRQLTWFNADSRVEWFDSSKSGQSGIVKAILRRVGI